MNKVQHVDLGRTKNVKRDYIMLWVMRENSCNYYSSTGHNSLRLIRMEYIFNSFMESA